MSGAPDRVLWAAGSALVVIALATASSGWFPREFVWDDTYLVERNPALAGPGNALEVFLHPWAWGTQSELGAAKNTAYYRPLAMLSLLIDRQVWGLWPAGYRLTSGLLHALTVLLVFGLALRLGAGSAPAFLAAALFAVHPTGCEVISIAAYRTTLLCTLFMLLGAWVHLSPRDPRVQVSCGPQLAACSLHARPSWRACLVGVCALAAMLSQESGVVFLLVLPLVHCAAGRRADRSLAGPFVWSLAGAALAWGARVLVTTPVPGAATAYFTFSDRLLLAAKLWLRYLATLAAPWPLSAAYDFSVVPPPEGLLDAWVIGGGAAAAALAALVIVMLRRGVLGAWLLAAFALALLPYLHLVPFRVVFADRFLYAPAALVALAGALLASRLPSGVISRVAAAAVVAAGVACAALSVVRHRDFADADAILAAEVRNFPDGFNGHFALAQRRLGQGRLEDALAEADRALAIWPGFEPAVRLRQEIMSRNAKDTGRR